MIDAGLGAYLRHEDADGLDRLLCGVFRSMYVASGQCTDEAPDLSEGRMTRREAGIPELVVDVAALRRDLVRARSWGGEFQAAIERWLRAHPGVLA